MVIGQRTLRRVSSILGLLGAVTALLAIHSTHWAALQTVAWGKMFVSYVQEGSVLSAVTRTFDGKNPCAMCLKVREGIAQEKQSSDQKAPAPAPSMTGEALWEFRVASTPPPPLGALEHHACIPLFCSDVMHRPPSPPPRLS